MNIVKVVLAVWSYDNEHPVGVNDKPDISKSI